MTLKSASNSNAHDRDPAFSFRIKRSRQSETGAALLVTIVMLVIVLLIGLSMAATAIMNEKSARNERDRVVALQAAESALADAELDIENSMAPNSRSTLFSPHSTLGFTLGCGRGNDNPYQGLCLNTGDSRSVPWHQADIANTGSNSASVPFGRFTGQTLPVGGGPLSVQLPRYIIELMIDSAAGQSASADQARYMYRITALGFGADADTEAVVQSFYRKSKSSGQ